MDKKTCDILMKIAIGGLTVGGLILIALSFLGEGSENCLYFGLGALALETLFIVGRKSWTKE